MKNWENLEADVNKILSKHYSSGRSGAKVNKVIVHYNAGDLTVEGCYSVWQSRAASAHYQVEFSGRIGQLVWDKDTAWHAGNWNANISSIGIEHANKSGGTITEECLDNGAHLVAAICEHYKLGRPQWLKNVFPHKYFAATACPGQIYGSQKDAYIKRAQAWYDHMVNGADAPQGGDSGSSSSGSTSGGSSSSGSTSSYKEHTGTGFGGKYKCNVDAVNVRVSPDISAEIVAVYKKGQTVTIDDWYCINDGWVWGRYTGGTSGKKRYIAIGKPTGKAESGDYFVKVKTIDLGSLNYWGPKYTKEMQRQLGTTVDGIVSKQPKSNKKYLANADTSSWKFYSNSSNYKGGSPMVKALQRKVGATVDGYMGSKTVKALQKWLINRGYSCGKSGADGKMGKDTCNAVGRALQNNAFA